MVKDKSREIEMRKEMAKVPSFKGLDAKKFRGSKQTDRREVDRAEKKHRCFMPSPSTPSNG